MKKVKIELEELLAVLEAMRDSGGTTEIIIFEHNSLPAICDANEPDNIVTFRTDGEDDFAIPPLDDDAMH